MVAETYIEGDEVARAHCASSASDARGDDTDSCVDETVYVGSFDETFYALDALTGARRWSYTTNGARAFRRRGGILW